jgi:hypothetical protein
MDRMKHNRDHHRQKNGIQKRLRNQIAEVESDCCQGQQKKSRSWWLPLRYDRFAFYKVRFRH